MAVQKNFVIKNGLEVNTNLIFADAEKNRVGIATTAVNNTLEVNGTISAKSSTITGVSTFNDVFIGGKVSVANSFGKAGQYLVSTGAGITWSSVPTVRSTDLQTAGVGETSFNTTYAVGLLDVYINGVKLSSNEYTANTGATVVLNDACFGGETVEFISYSPFGIGVGGTSIQGITILEEGTPIGNPLEVTSINFVGASVTAVGSGIGVTVYVADSSIANPSYWESTGVGIHTLSNVGIGTTNPRFALEVGAVGASGTTLYVNGDARITGILTVGSSSITLDGSSNTINVGTGITIQGDTGEISATSISINGETIVGGGVTSITAGSGISIDQSIGNVTITATGGVSSSQWETTDVGIHTLSNVGIGTTDPTSALTVKGNTSLETLNVSGVSTCNGLLYALDGINIGDGGLTNIEYSAAATERFVFRTNNNVDFFSFSDYYGGFDHFVFEVSKNGDVTNSGNLSISGISTFAGITTVTGTTLFSKQLSVSGITSTANLNVGTAGTVITATSAGLVGINSTSPSKTLDVVGDVKVGINTSQGIILTSQNGTQYRLIVANDGTLSTVVV